MLKFASHQLLWKFWPYEPQKKVIMIIFFMIPVDIFSKIVEDVGVKLLNHDIFITCFANNIFFLGRCCSEKNVGVMKKRGRTSVRVHVYSHVSTINVPALIFDLIPYYLYNKLADEWNTSCDPCEDEKSNIQTKIHLYAIEVCFSHHLCIPKGKPL